MDKKLPHNAGDTCLIPGWGTKIPHATAQLSLCAPITEPALSRAHVLQLESPRITMEGFTWLNEEPTYHSYDLKQSNK